MYVSLGKVEQRLRDHYGAPQSEPVPGSFEALLAVLVARDPHSAQARQVRSRLREADLDSPAALCDVHLEELALLIDPRGKSNSVALRLHAIAVHLTQHYHGSLSEFFSRPPEALRAELIALRGIGRETADSILLFAGGLPVFPVSVGTYRVLARHGWIDHHADYDDVRQQCEQQLEGGFEHFQLAHRLLEQVASEHCRPQVHCEECPLKHWLPPHGPCEP